MSIISLLNLISFEFKLFNILSNEESILFVTLTVICSIALSPTNIIISPSLSFTFIFFLKILFLIKFLSISKIFDKLSNEVIKDIEAKDFISLLFTEIKSEYIKLSEIFAFLLIAVFL